MALKTYYGPGWHFGCRSRLFCEVVASRRNLKHHAWTVSEKRLNSLPESRIPMTKSFFPLFQKINSVDNPFRVELDRPFCGDAFFQPVLRGSVHHPSSGGHFSPLVEGRNPLRSFGFWQRNSSKKNIKITPIFFLGGNRFIGVIFFTPLFLEGNFFFTVIWCNILPAVLRGICNQPFFFREGCSEKERWHSKMRKEDV